MKTKYSKKQLDLMTEQYFLGGMTGGDLAGAGTSAATGALTGASLGPAGAIIGGGVGLVKGLFGAKGNADKRAVEAENQSMSDNMLTEQRLQSIKNLAAGGSLGMVANDGNIGGPQGFQQFNNGGSHESNPLGGIPISQKQDGTQNLVEEGETKNGDYVFSDRLKLATPEAFMLDSKYSGKSFADVSKSYNKQLEERPNDPIAKSTFKSMTSRLEEANTDAKMQESINTKAGGKMFASGGNINEGEYDLNDADLDMQEIEYLKSKGYNASPINVNEFAEGGKLDPIPASDVMFSDMQKPMPDLIQPKKQYDWDVSWRQPEAIARPRGYDSMALDFGKNKNLPQLANKPSFQDKIQFFKDVNTSKKSVKKVDNFNKTRKALGYNSYVK